MATLRDYLMALSSNTRLGHYEIRSLLGAGGMGEVYLAHDSRLERAVALKVLPAEVAGDEQRMIRFIREAKSAAALNHPAIAHIYEVGEAEGTTFIAMEFIDGATLREKIHHDKTDLKKLLGYLTQVAEGLAKAHAAGIVHRDLKPDNIMITRDGYAKILDFGLAKLIEAPGPQGAGGNASSEAVTAALPQHSTPGTVMGTVGYMSPEQAQGKVKEIDQRSDVFSFGCILYEAVTGQRPFKGETAIETLHKVVYEQPPPLIELNPAAPIELQRVVRRCLAKDPEERYQSIKDVAIELKELRREMEGTEDVHRSYTPTEQDATSASSAGSAGSQPPAASTAGQAGETKQLSVHSTSSAEYLVGEIKRHRAGALVVLGLLILALAVGVYGIYRLTAKRHAPTLSFQDAKWTRLTTSGKVRRATISPDGKYVVYVHGDPWQQSLWVRQIATSSNVEIVAPAQVGYLNLTFTPDGDYVYYILESKDLPRRALYRVTTLGGEPKRVLVNLDGEAISFSPDGKRFVFSRTEEGKESALIIANADGSGEQKLVAHRPPEACRWPTWSPDGKTIAYVVVNFDSNDMTVFEAQAANGSVRPLTSQRWFRLQRMAWLSDGSGLLMLANAQQGNVYQIWHLSYPGAEARRVTNDLNDYGDLSLTADSKTLATVQYERPANIWVAPDGDATRARQLTSGAGKSDGRVGVSWTPDGRIVYSSRAGDSDDIWIIDADGRNQRQLTANARININPAVTPDGRHLFFLSDRTGVPHIWRMDIDGSNPKQLTNGVGEQLPSCSPDGRWVVYQTVYGKQVVWRVPSEGGEPVPLTDKFAQLPVVSPDGKWIAYFHLEDNSPVRLGIIPFEGGQPVKTFDVPPTLYAPGRIGWTPGGRSVAYVDLRDGVSNIWAQPLDGGPAKRLTDFKSDRIFGFEWSRDGKQLALSRGTIISDMILIKDFR
jgi:serine/threonine protein kinase/Tol biopolymer transport system component